MSSRARAKVEAAHRVRDREGAPRGRYLQGWVSFRALPTKDAKDSTPSLKLIHPNQTAYSTLLENFPQLRKVPKL